MTPSEKFKVDKHVLKEQRVNRIMAAAFDLFSKKGQILPKKQKLELPLFTDIIQLKKKW